MAEEDAEIALLHQMQAGQDNVAWEDGNQNGAAEAELPSNTENNNEQEVKKDSVVDDQSLRALSPSGAVAIPPASDDDDDGDYDPASLNTLPAFAISQQEESRSSSRASARKPKTVGGFIAEDSDEETDASTPQSGFLQAKSPNRAISPSPLHNAVNSQDVAGHEGQDDSKLAPHQTAITSVTPEAEMASAQLSMQQQPGFSSTMSAQTVPIPKARLPNDRTGILEDRIKEDPRGDLDAWDSLIKEHRNRNKLDDARAVYERFFKIFPQAAKKWVEYAQMELDNDNFGAAEQIFGKSLLTVPNVELWSIYLNYIRRRNDLTNDMSGQARATISQAYDFVLDNIGVDKDSGRLWQEYIQFIRTAPGNIGESSWQDQQKMDQLRKAYQRAICVPMSAVHSLWTEYNEFEMGLNKVTGRKFLQERSPGYMTARSAEAALKTATRGLERTTLPRPPPALGFDGDQEYLQQVEIWRNWIQWEQDDHLVLKEDERDVYQKRVLYVYKQALMALRFWPEMWISAADWCIANGLEKETDNFLAEGMNANPESCLVAFKKADHLESTLPPDEPDKGPAERGAIVRAPYDRLLDALYDLVKELKVRETRELAKLEESAALDASISAIISKVEDEDGDEDGDSRDKEARDVARANQAKVIQQGYASQTQILSRTISFAWIALMRAMRRVQGKGSSKEDGLGFRRIFFEARRRGKITSDVYVASALIEHHVYKDNLGTKIFERATKLFPEDEVFILAYLKHLVSIGDNTNVRAVFETAVNRLIQKPELVPKAKALYVYFHEYESQYGGLIQIKKLEQRMAELFPEDPKLLRFSARFSADGFDPTAVRPIVSPATQMKPKSVMQSIEQPTPVAHSPRPQYIQEHSPRPQYLQATNSPKRPFPIDDFDNDVNRPRKLARGESPLKGAAGRRLDQQKRLQQNSGTAAWQPNAPPFVIPRDITFLLSIIPAAHLSTNLPRYNAEKLVRILSQVHIPDYGVWKAGRDQPQRYDGMRPSHREIPHPRVIEVQGSQDGWPAPETHRSVNHGYPGNQYGAQLGGTTPQYYVTPQPEPPLHAEPSRAYQTTTDAYGREQQLRVEQSRPSSSGGYGDTRGPGGERGWQNEGPYLTPSDNWYQR